MSIDYRLISIGTLAAHPLWNEKGQVRTGHATTVLISSAGAHILVNPSLPAPALLARISERTSLRPEDITHVFLTSFQADQRRALRAFDMALWLLHEAERQSVEESFQTQIAEAEDGGDEELVALIEAESDLLARCEVAADSLAPGVDLFPLPGVTPGTCGLLLAQPNMTTLICGDAVATSEHLEQGKVLPNCVSIEQAQESFREAVEIADVLIPGRDNILLNPLHPYL